MKCPHCDVNLLMSERQGVEIDYCPECRGVWLDRGELDKIVERSHAESTAGVRAVATAPPPPRRDRWGDPGHSDVRYDDRARDDRHDPRYAKKKKRKSFIEDIFDF
jgi:Zn-finger nucleic acid-binding protein